MINPILPKLKEGDVVLSTLPFGVNQNIYQIIKLKNLKYEPEDEEFPNRNWLNFEGEVLYTSQRVHKSYKDFIFINCMAIREILNPFLIEKYVRDYMLFKPEDHFLSDEEEEYSRNIALQYLATK